jgi:hypothetical protein
MSMALCTLNWSLMVEPWMPSCTASNWSASTTS